MEDVKIYPGTINRVRDELCHNNGRAIVHYDISRSKTWLYNRNIELSCLSPEYPITVVRYHFCLPEYGAPCYVSLQIKPQTIALKHFVDFLKENTQELIDKGVLEWGDNNRCAYLEVAQDCRLTSVITHESEVEGKFLEITSIFDPLIAKFVKEENRAKRMLAFGKGIPFSETDVSSFQCEIVKIKNLNISSFRIPPYQRTYKWKPANVNQLINDIREYAKDGTYRLGSLVLHKGDIVDGQQRIVTLSLLLHRMMLIPQIRHHEEYQRLFDEVIGFWKRTGYYDQEAVSNIVANSTAIKMREIDLDEDFMISLFERCEFVVIRLPELHEAFQFFDSQNARGKDLEPHDLLKAYHLREIPEIKERDSKNISRWQNIATPQLVSLFLCLYRIRMWSKGASARFFLKADIHEFKGISIGKDKNPLPLYMPSLLLERLFNEFCGCGDYALSNDAYPFQLSGVVINGSRFFEMILHYNELFKKVTDSNWEGFDEKAQTILRLVNRYDGMNRVGDEYVRNVFDALLLFYIDKFGTYEIGKATELFFFYAYSIRIRQFRVSLATIDKSMIEGTLFKTLREAVNPNDLLNYQVYPLSESGDEIAYNRSQDLFDYFAGRNMIVR